MKLRFWVEHSSSSSYYHTSKTVEIPDEMLGDLCSLNDETERISEIEIVE